MRKCIGNAIEKAMRSGSDFSLIWLALGTLLGTFWHPEGPKDPPSDATYSTKSPQEAPKIAQGAPQVHPGPPKRFPRAPRTRPRQPQGRLKGIFRSQTLTFQKSSPAEAKSRFWMVGGTTWELKIKRQRLQEKEKNDGKEGGQRTNEKNMQIGQ